MLFNGLKKIVNGRVVTVDKTKDAKSNKEILENLWESVPADLNARKADEKFLEKARKSGIPENEIQAFLNMTDDSKDENDILTLDDDKELEGCFAKDSPPDYYNAIVTLARRANNPSISREYVRKNLEPFMKAQNVPFMENEFNQAFSEFNRAGTSKAAFYQGKDSKTTLDKRQMTSYLATAIAEGFGEGEGASREEQIEAWQYLVDTGLAWSLQGWFGRTATDLIRQGVIHAKDSKTKDEKISLSEAMKLAKNELYPDKDYHTLNSTEQDNVAIRARELVKDSKTKDSITCEYCGKTKADGGFFIGASKEPDWTMVEGTGKITCPDCYEKAMREGQARIKAHVNSFKGRDSKSDILDEIVSNFKKKSYDKAVDIAKYFKVNTLEEALSRNGYNKSMAQAGSRFLKGIITHDQLRSVESKPLIVKRYSMADDLKHEEENKENLEVAKDASQSVGMASGITQAEYNAEMKLLKGELDKAIASGNNYKVKEVEKEMVALEQEFKTKDSKTKDENGYVAFYKGKRAEVYADTKYNAQLKAAEILGAKKPWEVAIELAEKDGVQVVHRPVDKKTTDVVKEYNDVLISINKNTSSVEGGFLAIARINGQNFKVIQPTEVEAFREIKEIIDEKVIIK